MHTEHPRTLKLKTALTLGCALGLIAGVGAGCASDAPSTKGDAGPGTLNGGAGASSSGTLDAGKTGTATSNSTDDGDAGSSDGSTAGAGRSTHPADSGVTDAAAGGGTPLANGACKAKLSGVYAMVVDMDVFWVPLPDLLLASTTDAGRGRLKVYLELTADQVANDGTFAVDVKTCGIALPDLLSTVLCDYYKPVFADALWDATKASSVKGKVSSFAPGGVLSIPLTSYLYGIQLDDPSGAWPSAAQTASFACGAGVGADCFCDLDGDSKAGVTISFADLGKRAGGACGSSTWEYSAPPLTLNPAATTGGAARAADLYAGARFRAELGGKVGADCASGGGVVKTDKFDLRVLECRVQEGTSDDNVPAGPNQACTAAQAQFIDGHLPVYIPLNEGETPPVTVNGINLLALNLPGLVNLDTTPSKGAISRFVRLGDVGGKFNCANVRGAAFPAQ